MVVVIAIIKLVVILCIVATIHEFGHFIAAKMFGIGVKKFSIGFGPKIVQKKFKETMYSLRWIPFGGYVMIEGEGEESDKPNSMGKKNALQKCIVLVMGVVFNVILASIILLSISFSFPTYTTEITEMSNNSVLNEHGVKVGDKITKINGKDVMLSQELIDQNFADNKTTKIEYISGTEKKEITLNNAVRNIGYIGVVFKVNNNLGTNIIDQVDKNKAAEKAGIKVNDKIISINDIEVNDSISVIDIIKKNPSKTINVVVERDLEIVTLQLTPDAVERFDLGITNTKAEDTNLNYAFAKTIKTISSVGESYINIFRGKVGIDDVSSIVGIGVVVSKTQGLLEFLNIMAIISLAVGVANLLPILPLDGGKIVLVLVEALTRKKVSLKTEETISYIGFGLLILLTVVVMFKDIISLF